MNQIYEWMVDSIKQISIQTILNLKIKQNINCVKVWYHDWAVSNVLPTCQLTLLEIICLT